MQAGQVQQITAGGWAKASQWVLGDRGVLTGNNGVSRPRGVWGGLERGGWVWWQAGIHSSDLCGKSGVWDSDGAISEGGEQYWGGEGKSAPP